MRLLGFLQIIFFVVGLSFPAYSQQFERLLRDFDSNALTQADKRFLQTALAFEGDYIGLLDGAWGRLSQRAMEQYSRREYSTASEDWHMAMLAYGFFSKWSESGWRIEYIPKLGLSFLIPKEAVVIDPPSEYFANIRHTKSSLSISTGVHRTETAVRFHEFTLSEASRTKDPYVVRKKGLAVTSIIKPDGSALYTRSDYINGAWSTIMLSANRYDANVLGAVSSSIQKGYAPPIIFTQGGYLENILKQTNELLAAMEREEEKPGDQRAATTPPKAKRGGQGSQGSGFFVSDQGHVLTNAHVVETCSRFTVDGESATLVGQSKTFDLALLRTELPIGRTFARFSPSPPQLNSDVTAVGFPYSGLLGGLNVTRGAISALQGLGGDETTLQISAPIQSGNSGGPLLGDDGEVVGVVVSKLDAKLVSEVLGDVPQNVNFAVRGEIAKLFLSQNGVDPVNGETDLPLDGVTLARQAQAFTVQIVCE
ncbi:Serine protease, trypsin family protein [Roseobacter sp. MED193]|uniref:S1C family serine protease n=1 Tax=Roseobacter sp. MED193 TaxID=314262 RepID=UPI000068E3D8|nr:serine protease [Roseobacter sp. MED193]EAQ43653.1 Serine protease, trypsin family protein [Roseobacter sp. MED193]